MPPGSRTRRFARVYRPELALRRQTDDAIDGFAACLPGALLLTVRSISKTCWSPGPIQIVGQGAAGGQAAHFKAAMPGIDGLGGAELLGDHVAFDDKMTLTADELSMGPLQVSTLAMVGRLSTSDGKLQFESESVSPGGLMTAMLPTVANQVLAQFAAQWYIEDVRVRDGQLELRIR